MVVTQLLPSYYCGMIRNCLHSRVSIKLPLQVVPSRRVRNQVYTGSLHSAWFLPLKELHNFTIARAQLHLPAFAFQSWLFAGRVSFATKIAFLLKTRLDRLHQPCVVPDCYPIWVFQWFAPQKINMFPCICY